MTSMPTGAKFSGRNLASRFPALVITSAIGPRALRARAVPCMTTLAQAVPACIARVPVRGKSARSVRRCGSARYSATADMAWDNKDVSLRLVAVDMDGTLLRPDNTISETTVDTLRRVHACGATVCVASGRPAATIRRYAKQLNLGPIPAVCFNGACSMLLDGDDAANDVVWHEEVMSREVVIQVLDVAEKLDLPVQYCLPDKSVTAPSNPKQSKLMDQFDALVGPEGHSERIDSLRPADGNSSWPFPPPLKLIVITGSQSAADSVRETALETLPSTTCHIIAAEVHTEFLMPGVDKASGLLQAGKALGIDLTNAVAFGDANNDVEMLHACGLSYAMPNGRQGAIDAADRVCRDDNANDGVAGELKTLLLDGAFGIDVAPATAEVS